MPRPHGMYDGSISSDKIIRAFTDNVPGCYVRDYRQRGGFITVCRWYRDIKWRDQTTTCKVERQVPAITLVNLPQGNVTSATHYKGLRLDRPGWKLEFRKAKQHLTEAQQRRITRDLAVGEVFDGIREADEDEED